MPARVKLVSDFYDDLDTLDSSDNASEAQNTENTNDNESYVKELEERKKYVQEFINKSFQHFKKGLDFGHIQDQDMNYYQENYRYHDVNDRPMLGDVPEERVTNDSPDYDPDYDEEVNRLLDEVEEEILQENSNPTTEDNAKAENGYTDPKREQYEDCYDEFPEDMHHVGPIPKWYQTLLDKKINETRIRLENLSKLVCFACASAGAHIKRIEQDHSTVFCKMDFPKHPPMNKPWTNFWKFNCMIKCKEMDKPNHAHKAECESVLLEHATTGVSTLTQNISENEYPKFVMDAVELFQDFAIETTKNVPFLDSTQATDTVYEKPIWTEIKLRSNYKNELMMVVRGKGVTSLISKLKRYFDSGPGRTSNVISLFCINQKWSQKKSHFPPSYITGLFKLRDKVGPITINYEPKTNPNFNSVEAIQLGKIIQDYAGLTDETTLLDLGCNFGVLSLMMSHRCDRVIGLNTMHFVNSEINQAEELKKLNRIHNVSFMGCDPKDVLTKCSTLIKRCITVAVLNLASPYGKSMHVMQALRDLPSIWRVIIYGSFDKEFHRNISTLTSKDELLGDHYLPMQYCILDKSMSDNNGFDIVILFERKSLITPKLEILAPGPTVNVNVDCDMYNYGSLDSQDEDVKPVINMRKGFGTKLDYRAKKYQGKPFIKYRRPLNKFGKFDSPMLPLDNEQKPEIPKGISTEKAPTPLPPPSNGKKYDFSLLRQKAPPVQSIHKGNDRSAYPSIRKELQVKELKRIFDSPYLPVPKEEKLPVTDRDRSLSPPPREKTFDCSVLKKCSYPSISVKKEFRSYCPSPPREKFVNPPHPPGPPPPSMKCSMLDASQIKKEKDSDYSTLLNVKTEPAQAYEDDDKEEGELSPEDDRFPEVPVKSESIDPSYFVGFSEIDKNKIKLEPADQYEIPFESQLKAIKHEPVDMQISDIESMETPKREPNATGLSDSAHSSPLVAGTNFTTVDGFEFSVRANQSFLPFKCDPDASSGYTNSGYDFKTKPVKSEPFDTDEEIKIIDERRPSTQLNKQQEDSEGRIRVKSLDNIIKVKSEFDQNDDLRSLIEKRKTIQRKLNKDKETRCYKELNGRSPSPELPCKYRRQTLPSPPFRKYHRSPSPRRFARSPSPKKSISRLTSPCRYRSDRSPSSRRAYRRSSPSPVRTWIKRDRSPLPSIVKKYERSPSPARTWTKRERSPSSIIRKYERSPSPNGKRYRKSPPSPIRFIKREQSPVRLKKEPRSPVINRWGDRSRKSPSSPSSQKSFSRWEIDHRSKSPVKPRHDTRKKRSRSRSPDEIKRKGLSLSPIASSPSQPKKCDASEHRRKKKKKLKSKSKSPSRTAKKIKARARKDDSQWDIPALSTLSSTAKSSDHIDESAVQATIESVPLKQTESEKRERASRSRSRTPIPGVEDIIQTEAEAASEVGAM